MQKKISLIIVLIFTTSVIFTSGCTNVQTGNGVAITEFYTDFEQVLPGEKVDFYVKMQNLGSKTATNVFGELFGLDSAWYSNDANLGEGPWVGQEKLPNEIECRYTENKHFSLSPPNQMFGTPGQEHICTWTYKAPNMDHGMTASYEPKIRVFYDYETSADIGVVLVPREEMIRLQNNGDTPDAHIISKSSSPVDIDIQLQSPIRVSENTVSFLMETTVTNSGDGVTCLKGRCKNIGSSESLTGMLTLTINIPENSDLSFDCEGAPKCSLKSMETVIQLYKGTNMIIQRINANLKDITTQQTRTIKINLDYSYFTEKTISVKVVSD